MDLDECRVQSLNPSKSFGPLTFSVTGCDIVDRFLSFCNQDILSSRYNSLLVHTYQTVQFCVFLPRKAAHCGIISTQGMTHAKFPVDEQWLIAHPSPNVANLCFVSQGISTTHALAVIKNVDQINRFDFMGLNPTGCQIAISSSLIKRLRAEGTSLKSGLIIENIYKLQLCCLVVLL